MVKEEKIWSVKRLESILCKVEEILTEMSNKKSRSTHALLYTTSTHRLQLEIREKVIIDKGDRRDLLKRNSTK